MKKINTNLYALSIFIIFHPTTVVFEVNSMPSFLKLSANPIVITILWPQPVAPTSTAFPWPIPLSLTNATKTE